MLLYRYRQTIDFCLQHHHNCYTVFIESATKNSSAVSTVNSQVIVLLRYRIGQNEKESKSDRSTEIGGKGEGNRESSTTWPSDENDGRAADYTRVMVKAIGMVMRGSSWQKAGKRRSNKKDKLQLSTRVRNQRWRCLENRRLHLLMITMDRLASVIQAEVVSVGGALFEGRCLCSWTRWQNTLSQNGEKYSVSYLN